MPPARSRRINFNLLPLIPHTTAYYGTNARSGTPGEARTFVACDLDLDNVSTNTWEEMVPKYVQLSDAMVGSALEHAIAIPDLLNWYPADFVADGPKDIAIRPERKSQGHPSLDKHGRVHHAYGVHLVGDGVHGVDPLEVGIKLLAHPLSSRKKQYAITNDFYEQVIQRLQPHPNIKNLANL
jgi:hypothetical protein